MDAALADYTTGTAARVIRVVHLRTQETDWTAMI
jgi:hypothetical protein